MPTLLYTDPRFADHDTRPGHPERPARLRAVAAGVERSAGADDVVVTTPVHATFDDVARVHDRTYLDALANLCARGGGRIDPDTVASARSWDAAMLAAGAGLDAAVRLEAGEAGAAFLAVRPPGHHATRVRAMGFCLVNNVAVCAAALAGRGERVLVVDIDAHHGNGTQDIFWNDPDVTYVSLHQWPLYPGTGALEETGGPGAPGGVMNVPLPPGAAGDTYRRAVDELLEPLAERVAPTWVLLSTGFDAHRADPLTGLGLSAGDYGDLTARILGLVPAGRRIAFLEGGYDLDAIASSTSATLAALSGLDGDDLHPEPVTSGGPGIDVVLAVARLHDLA